MPSDRTPDGRDARHAPVSRLDHLSEADARWVLQRAAECDSTWETTSAATAARPLLTIADPTGPHAWNGGVPVAWLHEAALEAGIAPAAFAKALSDLRTVDGTRRSSSSRRVASTGWRWRVVASSVTAVVVAGLATVALSVRSNRTPPPGVAVTAQGLAQDAVRAACALDGGVPVERLRGLAHRLQPEALTSRHNREGIVVGLLFDARCTLTAHTVTRRVDEDITLDKMFARLFPNENSRGDFRVAGIAQAAEERSGPGAPLIVWGVVPTSQR